MTHTFSVVHITELDEIEPVPHQWVQDGALFWPPSKREVRRYQSDASSIPDAVTWIQYSCTIKAQGLLFYTHASAKADQLCIDSTDTDDGIVDPTTKRKRTENKLLKGYTEFLPTKPMVNSEEATIDNVHTALSETNSTNCAEVEQTEGDKNFEVCALVPEVDIKTIVDLISEFKLDMKHRLAEISAKQDRIEELVQSRYNEFHERDTGDQSIRIFPLDSVVDVHMFEDNLKNEKYRLKMISYLRRITGAGQSWKSAAYKLSSFLFTK